MQTTKRTPLAGPAARTPEWLAMRRNPDDPKFGATDAAALLGVSKWKTPRHVYESFFREPEPENSAMRSGRHLEPAVQRMWAEENDRPVIVEIPSLIDQEAPIFASLDSVAIEPISLAVRDFGVVGAVSCWETGFERVLQHPDAVLEVKTSMSRAVADELGEDGSDYIPTDWLCQVQQQLDIVDLDEAFVAVLIFGRLRTFPVKRNHDLGKTIRERAVEMRDRILHRDPPPLDFTHPGTPELVRSLKGDTGPAIEVPADVAEWWRMRQSYSEEIRDLEKWRAEAAAHVEAWLVERGVEAGLLPDGKRIVRRTVNRKGYTVEPKSFTEVRELKA